jgi:hypothetical protein
MQTPLWDISAVFLYPDCTRPFGKVCNIFKAVGPLLAKPQLTPATQSEDRHVCIVYPYDYEDGSGLNEEHNIMDGGPAFSFHLQRIGGKGWGCSILQFTHTPKVLH